MKKITLTEKEKRVKEAFDQIKKYVPFDKKYDNYIVLVLQELYTHGKWEGLEVGQNICVEAIGESMTEEQLIERERVSSEPVTNSSEIV